MSPDSVKIPQSIFKMREEKEVYFELCLETTSLIHGLLESVSPMNVKQILNGAQFW